MRTSHKCEKMLSHSKDHTDLFRNAPIDHLYSMTYIIKGVEIKFENKYSRFLREWYGVPDSADTRPISQQDVNWQQLRRVSHTSQAPLLPRHILYVDAAAQPPHITTAPSRTSPSSAVEDSILPFERAVSCDGPPRHRFIHVR